MQWQDFGQLRGAARVLSIDTDLEFALAIPRNAQGAVPTLSQFNLAKDRARQLLVLNDRQQSGAAKRTGKPQQMDGFQNTGFAAAVGAVKDIDSGGGGEGHRVQIAHRGDRDAT
ncbi:hypothetical protein D9M73_160020 [compost metagenome]